jgi:hypothetical protein
LYTALPHSYGSSQKEHGVKRVLLGLALVSGFSGLAFGDVGGAPTGTVVEEAKIEKKVPFYGFSFDFTAADGTGLNSVGENYRNDLAFYFEPSWNVGARFFRGTWAKTFQIAARFAVTQELSGTDEASFNGVSNSGPHGTCSNITPSINGGVVNPNMVGYCNPPPNDRRADYSDIWLTFRLPRAYTIPKALISISPSLRFYLPTSAQSRYQTLIMGLNPAVGFGRTFWKDRIKVGYSLGYTKNFHQSEVPVIDPSQPIAAGGTAGSNSFDGSVGTTISNFYLDPSRAGTVGGFNVSQQVTNIISGSIQITDKLSFDALYILVSPFTYTGNCLVNTQGQTVDTCATGNAVAAASGSTLSPGQKGMSQVLWLTLGYQFYDWFNLSLAWINWAPTYYPSGGYRQGVISTDYNAFTTVQLGATITIDKLAQKFRKN